jgi:multidrug resistance efflux pump
VSGPIVALPIKDNQFVKAGDLLFEIDPRTYQAALDQAKANLDETLDRLDNLGAQVDAAEAAVEQSKTGLPQADSLVASAEATLEKAGKDFERAKQLIAKGDVAKRTFDEAEAAFNVAQADLAKAQAQRTQATAALLQAKAELARAKADRGASGEDNAQLRGAKAALETAKLNLDFTRVEASVDGYVTNLNLRLGSQAVANQPALALVDTASFWVHGYFRETMIERVKPGDRAVITLMSYPDRPLAGPRGQHRLGHLPERRRHRQRPLAHREPHLLVDSPRPAHPGARAPGEIPDGVELRVGTTGSVLVMTGTADSDEFGLVPCRYSITQCTKITQTRAVRGLSAQSLRARRARSLRRMAIVWSSGCFCGCWA